MLREQIVIEICFTALTHFLHHVLYPLLQVVLLQFLKRNDDFRLTSKYHKIKERPLKLEHEVVGIILES